ncbi:coiled-coil domain-containing protein 60 isoform X2 [Psammomys obesus]|uniref:coiled-coil domain-containing protein 60 isoform X2 n=1 Tax=Psammomys obesus TaxID=48139 RepID=UPI002452FDC1|nr:coiled-coil domain-containing protein 60 isoform X2 [Psammomys obesus]
MMNLKKDLIRSRFLIRCVKVGRGYFNILREETAMKKKQQQLQKLLEEELEKFQPAQKVPDTHYRDSVIATYEEEKIKKLESMRPFSPVHSCIMAPSLPDSHVDPLFRQLCALHWLLEALTIDHTHHAMRPLIACWNPKDPGGSKSSIKKINKDKSMGQRWDHFVTAPKTKKFKVPAIRTASRKLSRRASTLSLSRTSGGSSPQSSMLSVNPGSDELPSVVTQGTGTGSKDIEDNESSSTKPEEEPLHPVLQKLLEMVREDARRAIVMTTEMQKKHPSLLSLNKSDYVLKEWQMTHKSSERSSTTSGDSHIPSNQRKTKGRANRDIIHCKSGVCNSMRAKFFSIAQEASYCLQDKMEILIKYFDLLSKLPEDLKSFRPARKILSKLQKFGENLDLRIRPHVLLKVLQDLRIWELCSPDIAVAIEFVREHIIHMPQEDYINWLQGRVGMPIRQQPAPP